MNISATILKIIGWKVVLSTPDFPKSIICVAPHTSNWDFIIGELAINSINRKSGFLMKEFWFFFPLSILLKAMGGIPVSRKKGTSLVNVIIDKFNNSEHLTLAVTPEGTRKKTSKWRTGFLRIAYGAKIPIQLASIDYSTKEVRLTDVFTPTYDVERDIEMIKMFYKGFKGKYPEKFSTEPQTENSVV